MAAADVQSLFLQVDASVELLRRNLAQGEQPLGRFEQRAAKMSQSVEKSIGDMGKRFGAFAQMAESAADKAQRSFESSFNDIQRMAAKAITAPTVSGGGLNLGAADARAAAEQARQEAVALGMIEQAARRAAAGQGEMTRETRLYLQAAQAARIEGEQRAAELLREAGALERLEIETLGAASALRVMDASNRQNTVSAGQLRAGQQQLGFQFQDLGVQLAMAAGSGNALKGSMTAIAMQGPQIISAIALMRGEASFFSRVLAGPTVSAVLAVVSVLAIVGSEFLSSGDKAEASANKVDRYTSALLRLASVQGQVKAQDLADARLGAERARGRLAALDAQIAASTGTRAAMQRRGQLQAQRPALEKELWNFEATAAGAQIAWDNRLKLDAMGEKPAGKKGPSAETLARRAEAAQNAILSDQMAYAQQERQARKRLLDAMGKTAATEEERDRLAREEIEADYQAEKTRIAAQDKKTKGGLSAAEAARLNDLNEQTRKQRLENVKIDRAREKIIAGYEAEAQSLDAKIAMKRIEGDMATTMAERRKVALELLALEQEQRRRALERARDTSNDPNEVQRAKDALGRLPAQEAAERGQVYQQTATPMEEYRQRILTATGDMQTALESVQVRGLENLEDGLVAIISGTESVGRAFKRMAASIIADLARIAIQKLIVSAIGGSIGGFAEGGKVQGFAGGGRISGPGTGTSDSILAMLGTKPIMLSNGESIVTAEATRKFWPIIDAMNKGNIKGLAGGGMVTPSLTAPRLPAIGGSSWRGSMQQSFHYDLRGALVDRDVYADMQAMADRARDDGAAMGARQGVIAAIDVNDRNYGRAFGQRGR